MASQSAKQLHVRSASDTDGAAGEPTEEGTTHRPDSCLKHETLAPAHWHGLTPGVTPFTQKLRKIKFECLRC